MMRLFLGLAISDLAESALGAVQDQLRVGRLVDPELFHVTLVFLGDVTQRSAEDLNDALEALVLPPVTLEIAGIGHFGHAAPRQIYAAVTPGEDLKRLQAKLAQAARGAGLAVEKRRFVPHVTLARLKGLPEDAPLVAAFAGRYAGLKLPVEAPATVTLYASHLRPDGPIYEVLAEYPLG